MNFLCARLAVLVLSLSTSFAQAQSDQALWTELLQLRQEMQQLKNELQQLQAERRTAMSTAPAKSASGQTEIGRAHV